MNLSKSRASKRAPGIAISKDMLVRIRDIPENGIWRGQTGYVTAVVGQTIRVTTKEGNSSFTAELLEPSPQESLL